MKSVKKKNKAAIAAMAASVAMISASPAFACYTQSEIDNAEDSANAAYDAWQTLLGQRDSDIADYDNNTWADAKQLCWDTYPLDDPQREPCIRQAAIDRENYIATSIDALIDALENDYNNAYSTYQEYDQNPCS
jgi:hypothetical protein